jgi:hypothetical protein
MSRSGYSDYYDYDHDQDNWATIRWSGARAAAFRGRRGQAFLREMLAALDALPAPRLVAEELAADGEVCALGAVGRARGMDMSGINPEDYRTVANKFGVAEVMARDIAHANDDVWETPETRWARMRRWVVSHIKA